MLCCSVQVHWLRIIVDEGHSLGASLGITNKLSMAVKLTAQRRWVMTGTPTPSTASGAHAGIAAGALYWGCAMQSALQTQVACHQIMARMHCS